MSKTILVVDDDDSVSSIFSFILEQAGYKTVTLHTSEECISYIQAKKKIDLLFLDIKLPDGSGIEAFKKIRQLNPELIVIVMTGYMINHTLKEAFELGAYGVLYKPFDIEEVLSTIEKLFKLPALS